MIKKITYIFIAFLCLVSNHADAMLHHAAQDMRLVFSRTAPTVSRRYKGTWKILYDVHKKETKKAWEEKVCHQFPALPDRYEHFRFSEGYGKTKSAYKSLLTIRSIQRPWHFLIKWLGYSRLLWTYYSDQESHDLAFYRSVRNTTWRTRPRPKETISKIKGLISGKK
jgi:hypothetical protein